MPQGQEGKPLIKSGDTFETKIPGAFRPAKTSDEQIAATNQNETFIVKSVIFDDGTFEGDINNAAQFLGFTFGRKSQLKQIIPLLQKASENDLKNGEFSRQLSNLSIAIDEIALNEFVKRFPNFTDREKPRFRGAAEVAMQGVKKTFFDELKALEENQKKAQVDISQDWLKAMREKYQNWLARLL